MKRTQTVIANVRKLALGLTVALVAIVIGLPPVLGQINSEPPSDTEEVADLNSQITTKRQEIDGLKQKAAEYQKAVDQAHANVRSIEAQLSNIQNQIALTNLEIEAKNAEIEALGLEMQAIQASIDAKEAELVEYREHLAAALKEVERASRTPLLKLLLLNTNFTDFFGQAQAYASLSDQLQSTVQTVQALKTELQEKQNQLDEAKSSVEQTRLQLEVNRQSSVEQKQLQDQLLVTAEQTEDNYTSLLQDALQQEQNANATISALERQLQQKLNGGGEQPTFNSSGFIWPVQGRITAYFRDPTYPFRCSVFKHSSCLEHTGLDIGVPQGTPVRATADGVVVAFTNYSTTQLNYISIFHGEGITSRYLHINKVLVGPEQVVRQGEVIGLSGGLPGTAGSGGLTTGPHLHFEIRVDGIPDDPLRYLN